MKIAINCQFCFAKGGGGIKEYIIQLTNNSEGGSESYGNDILLDDISIAICYPDGGKDRIRNIKSCRTKLMWKSSRFGAIACFEATGP